MNRYSSLIVIAAICGLACRPAERLDPPARADAPVDPATPRGAVTQIYRAALVGDVDAVAAALTPRSDADRSARDGWPDTTRESAVFLVANTRAHQAMRDAFGPAAADAHKGWLLLTPDDELSVLPEGADAAVAKRRDRILLLAREGARWKIALAGRTPPDRADELNPYRAKLLAFAKELDRIAAGVRAGRYPTPAAALADLDRCSLVKSVLSADSFKME